jgi:hypothetical protein
MKSDVQSVDTAVEPGWRSKLWFEDSPPFKVYIRSEWKDLLITVSLLILSLMLYVYARPPPTHHFLLDQEKYSHPLLTEFITTEVAVAMSFGVSFLVMMLCGISLQSGYWDTHSAVRRQCF